MRPPASTFSLVPNIPGSRCFNARFARRARCETSTGDSTTRKPATCSRDIVENAPSKSSAVRTGTMTSWTPSFLPAVSTACKAGRCQSVVGLLHTDPRRLRHRLLQYLQLLGDQVRLNDGQPR